MAYAEAMSQTPPTVTDGVFARLLDQLGEATMVELTEFISLANFYARNNVAFGIESDGSSPPLAVRAPRLTPLRPRP